MMKARTNAISADTISTVFSMLNGNRQIGLSMESFRKSSWLVKAVMVILLCIVGGGVLWYFMYHEIAPLMITVAITIPVLCLGITQQNSIIIRIIKEWSEYKTATDELIKLVQSATFDPETAEKVATAIAWVEDESDDVDQILLEIADNAHEMLEAAQEAVDSSTGGILGNASAMIKPNIIPKDETEDLSVKI